MNTAIRSFDTLRELIACVGTEVAVSDWFTITQPQINAFADATSDHQWIHVDPERARTGPFGTTIAHGFLTLALSAGFALRTIEVRDVRMLINYGLDRVRFVAPVPVDSRVRARLTLAVVKPIEGGQQLLWHCTLEREGSDKPVCVLDLWLRYYTAEPQPRARHTPSALPELPAASRPRSPVAAMPRTR